jgi:hypothetical protein
MISFGQDKNEFHTRTKYVDEWIKDFLAKDKDYSKTYAHYKLKAIIDEDNVVLKLEEDQKKQMTDLFYKQYPEFKAAYNKYADGKTAQSKIDLMKVLVKQEEEFRKLLTETQSIHYRSYDPDKKFVKNLQFKMYYMTDIVYMSYKKELL